jgi:hypothetical protein
VKNINRGADEFTEKMTAALRPPADYRPLSRRAVWAWSVAGLAFAGLISVSAIATVPTPEAAPAVTCLAC